MRVYQQQENVDNVLLFHRSMSQGINLTTKYKMARQSIQLGGNNISCLFGFTVEIN